MKISRNIVSGFFVDLGARIIWSLMGVRMLVNVLLGAFADLGAEIMWLLMGPGRTLARVAVAWIGPRPVIGQPWSTHQASWAMYSFAWLCQIALVFSALYFLESRFASITSHPWFLGVSFGLTLGAGMALLATIGVLSKAAKAQYLDPNPVCRPPTVGGTVGT
jgi:hypothetical protein